MATSYCDASEELREYLWNGTYSNSDLGRETEVINSPSKEQILEKIFSCLMKPPSCTVVRINLLQSSLEDAKTSLESFLEQEYHTKSMTCPKVLFHKEVADILLVSNKERNPNTKLAICDKVVIVGSQCGTAVLRGANVFAPGVMAAHTGMKRGDLVSVYSDVDAQCRRGLVKPFDGRKIFVGNGVAEMARNEIFCTENVPRLQSSEFQPCFNEIKRMAERCHDVTGSHVVQNIQSELTKYAAVGIAVRMTQPLYDSPSLNGFSPHCAFLQNLPSVVVSHVLGPKPGEIILDMCAAPGGKTTHIAQLMKNKGTVFALDKSKPKIDKIVNNMKKLQLTCIKPFLWDATKAVSSSEDNVKSEPVNPPFSLSSFDRILLDGPCSALGQRPQHMFKKSRKELESFPTYQKKLLTVAEKLLKPGGTLVYSTCTISSEENERQVAWALERFPSLQLARQDMHIGGFGIKNCGLSEEQRLLVQRFDPLDMDKTLSYTDRQLSDCDTIGFFLAKFIKKQPT